MQGAAATALKTLVVEDDPQEREAMRRALERAGFSVDCAGTAGAALIKLETGLIPAAAIIDMRLPDAGGDIVLWRVRCRDPAIPIAVVTGIANAAAHPELVRNPPDRLFTKPLDMDALIAWLLWVT